VQEISLLGWLRMGWLWDTRITINIRIHFRIIHMDIHIHISTSTNFHTDTTRIMCTIPCSMDTDTDTDITPVRHYPDSRVSNTSPHMGTGPTPPPARPPRKTGWTSSKDSDGAVRSASERRTKTGTCLPALVRARWVILPV
jgi:hypothetical protein